MYSCKAVGGADRAQTYPNDDYALLQKIDRIATSIYYLMNQLQV